MSRRKERELAFKVLFAHEFNPIPLSEQLDFLTEEEEYKKSVTNYVRQLASYCIEKKDEFDALIKPRLINWDFDRVAVVDKILLRMALAEFLYFEEIPPEVTIDEMIELGKKFGTPKSGSFINGILDALLKDLKAKNLIKKSGRGLITKIKLNGK
ncbi:MAG TPA: transcription antitermination factor NusB [Caldithrix abyssi]|uniref:Transcription antitermination protein NusB n=1 Tax=Caldithrix abyssi TaxID=187145 RepID=A0A7V5LJ07_CALAY|nr:transcription antitermination factor NusB [Caldisericaceae bacterium]HHE55628.1 transcription antitermination factor NusB [Caldithrix abyssi]